MGKHSAGKWAGAALAAGAIGYVAGVLTAPKSGKETRADIKHAASKARSEAEKKLKEVLADLNIRLDETRKKGAKLNGKAKIEYEKVFASAVIAKDKVREVLSALHDGDADDPELKDALKDAQNAIRHLKKYVTTKK